MLSGIVFVNRNGCAGEMHQGLRPRTRRCYNRWKRWGEAGVFTRMMEGLAAADAEPKTVMIDAYLTEGAPHGIEPTG